MPHPSKSTDDPAKRILADQIPPPDRTPTEQLAILNKVVNLKTEAIWQLSKQGSKNLDSIYNDDLTLAIDLATKLSREERQSDTLPDVSHLSDEEILARKK